MATVSRRTFLTMSLPLLVTACSPAAAPPSKPADSAKPAASDAPKPTGAPATAAPVGAPAKPVASAAGGLSAQFVIGSLEEPGNLSPLSALPHHFPEHVPQTLLFDSLIQVRPDGSIAPKLAESWEASADGLTYTFKLTDRARWWDGQPVTAEDVKFTVEAALKPETQSSTEGLVQLVLLIGLTGWMPVARLARGAFRELMTLPYVEAARACGADGVRIVGRHLLPNALGVLFVAALAQVNRSIMAEATISFLGMSVKPPAPTWGNLLIGAQDYLWTAPWLAVAPGIALTVTMLAIFLLGDRANVRVEARAPGSSR